MYKAVRYLVVLFAISFVFQSCETTTEKPKFVFLFVGDGMGVAQVNLTEAYLAAIKNEKGFQKLSFTQFPHAGLVSTYANNRFITCSAAAGTAFATGNKANIGHVSTDTTGLIPFKSIASICKENGMKVGILSSVSIDHATPAVFYAHQASRNNYFEIGLDLANSDFDFFGGGGLKSPTGEIDGNKIDTYQLAQQNGYKLVNSQDGLMDLTPSDKKVFAIYPELLESAAMPYVIDKPAKPTLADFTSKAIELLENEDGFFIMVEGGKIDWACHSNDAATSIHETIAFNEAVKTAITFYEKHPDETLIIVTADHETGGLALGAEKTKYESYFEYLQYQKISYDEFNSIIGDFQKTLSGNFDDDLNSLLDLVGKYFGLGKEIPMTDQDKANIWFAFEEGVNKNAKNNLYGDFLPITETIIQLMSEKSGVGWTTHAHTGINIPIYTIGPGAELFTGVIENTDIPTLLLNQLELNKK